MAFEFFKESYTGSIKEIALGKGDKAVTVGGEACYPFYQFEGKMPNKPKIAMEVWDMKPDEWPEAALAPTPTAMMLRLKMRPPPSKKSWLLSMCP